MAKSDREKLEFAERLLNQGLTYREIQQSLKLKFGSALSNTTLKKLNQDIPKIQMLEARNLELEQELALFRKLYFELLNTTKEKLNENS